MIYVDAEDEEIELGRTELSKKSRVASYGIKEDSVIYLVDHNASVSLETPVLSPSYLQDGLPIEVWNLIFSMLPSRGTTFCSLEDGNLIALSLSPLLSLRFTLSPLALLRSLSLSPLSPLSSLLSLLLLSLSPLSLSLPPCLSLSPLLFFSLKSSSGACGLCIETMAQDGFPIYHRMEDV